MSSSDIAVSVRGLGKAYTIKHNQTDHVTLAEVALDRLRHPFRRAEREQFWALKDVDLDVRQGDVVGVVGRNGAGKSTLLKILSRITEPSAGEVKLWGRVGSLLEVGTGFHPELTGRENVYLNGAILGMRQSEIASQFDAIVDFAGVERFLDTPVKRYSSGMYVRLAFAVAAHLDTEILLLDEVLAVGDGDFQAKCLTKVSEIAGGGRTVLLVSHNLAVMREYANVGAYLEQGTLVHTGPASETLDQYLTSSSAGARTDLGRLRRSDAQWGQRLRIESAEIIGDPNAVRATDDLRYRIGVTATEPLRSLRLRQTICTPLGERVATSFSSPDIDMPSSGEYTIDASIRLPDLAAGSYFLTFTVGEGDEFSTLRHLDHVDRACVFNVLHRVGPGGEISAWNREWWGSVRSARPEVLSVRNRGNEIGQMALASARKLDDEPTATARSRS